jgi:hypothetical protein
VVLFLFSGIVGIFIILIFKNSLIDRAYVESQILRKFMNSNWFKNHWKAGVFLFLANASLLSIVIVVSLLFIYLKTPFIHLAVAILAVIFSILLWVQINKGWQGSKAKRLIMGLIGSSFYLILTCIFMYRLLTLKPSYPGDDTFMASIGLMFVITVSTVAFVTCLIITGFEKRQNT